jgi:hypothetical protein
MSAETGYSIINGETWLFTGGRNFTAQWLFDAAIVDIVGMFGLPAKVVHGAADGLDTMADAWAKRMAIEVEAFPADWRTHGKPAGVIRNADMLILGKPRRVIAFPGGLGTRDMVERAHKAGVDIIEIRGHVTKVSRETCVTWWKEHA